jgi:hypothetical protein
LARWWWNVQVGRSAGYEGLSWRLHQSPDTKFKRYVANLNRHGVTTDKVLALATALYIARELIPESVAATDDHFRFQFCRLIIQSASLPLGPWHSQAGRPEPLGYRFAQHAGGKLQDGLGMFAGCAASAILGRPFAGFPDLADKSPVPPSVAQKAVKRPRYQPL